MLEYEMEAIEIILSLDFVARRFTVAEPHCHQHHLRCLLSPKCLADFNKLPTMYRSRKLTLLFSAQASSFSFLGLKFVYFRAVERARCDCLVGFSLLMISFHG